MESRVHGTATMLVSSLVVGLLLVAILVGLR